MQFLVLSLWFLRAILRCFFVWLFVHPSRNFSCSFVDFFVYFFVLSFVFSSCNFSCSLCDFFVQFFVLLLQFLRATYRALFVFFSYFVRALGIVFQPVKPEKLESHHFKLVLIAQTSLPSSSRARQLKSYPTQSLSQVKDAAPGQQPNRL